MNSVVHFLTTNSELLIFLSLGIGYYIGALKFKGFSLGATAGTLIVALVLGQMPCEMPGLLKTVSFSLFTFVIGYNVGPQFFGALKKEGVNYILIALVVAVVALLLTLGIGKLLHFDAGTTAGLLAGALTTSAAIGTAEGALAHASGLTDAARTTMESNVAVAYAITYMFGTVGGILMFNIMPRLMGFDLKDEAKKLERQLSGGTDDVSGTPGLFSWTSQLSLRAYAVTQPKAVGQTVQGLEGLFPQRVAIEAVRRNDQMVPVTPDLKLEANDVVLLGSSHRPAMLQAPETVGPEQDIAKMPQLVGETMDVLVQSHDLAGKTIGELAAIPESRGLFLSRIMRSGQPAPVLAGTKIEKGDILTLAGAKDDVERAVKKIGYAERRTAAADMVMIGIGITVGTLMGLAAVHVGGIPLTLGVGGGVLVSGLIFGWLRTLHPTFGRIPSGTRWFMQNLGLNLFIACVGLAAGSEAVHAIKTQGLTVFFAGMVLTIVPVLAGLFFAKAFLKLNPVLLMGALSGSRNLTAALMTLQEQAESPTPVLGYAAPYAIANVMLTIWGSLLISLML